MTDKKKTILLVEDDPDITKAIVHGLRRSGYLVATENDGQKALTQAAALPNLIILDLMLPRLSGEEICKAIRENDDENIAAIPIIMLTAKSSDADRIVGKVIGANRYMTKPFSLDELLQEVEKLTQANASKITEK